MRKIFWTTVTLGFFAAPAWAGPFDGVWDGSGAQCQRAMSDARVTVSETALAFWETHCTLSNPTAIRDMPDAMLYDAACSGEGETWESRVLLARLSFGGDRLLILMGGVETIRQRCDTPPVSGPDGLKG